MTDYPQNITDMIDDFSFLDDWEDRYMHVIELGKNLAPLSDAERNPKTKVNGCVSQVWLVADTSEENGHTNLVFRGDSDAHIVKGLLAVVLAAFNGKSAQGILAFDVDSYFEQLDLVRHLSPTRGNGLRAMVQKIKDTAAAS